MKFICNYLSYGTTNTVCCHKGVSFAESLFNKLQTDEIPSSCELVNPLLKVLSAVPHQ